MQCKIKFADWLSQNWYPLNDTEWGEFEEPDSRFTLKELHDIFTGEYKNWLICKMGRNWWDLYDAKGKTVRRAKAKEQLETFKNAIQHDNRRKSSKGNW